MALFCPPTNGDRIEYVIQRINEWITHDSFLQLLSSFNMCVPNNLSLPETLDCLVKFSDDWDFRKRNANRTLDTNENARWLINEELLSDDQKTCTMNAARDLGLIGISTPSKTQYDYVLVLGGARLSCLLRPKYAAYLQSSHIIDTNKIVVLGAFRPVADSEREATDTYAPNAMYEIDLLNAGVELSFGLDGMFSEERYDDCENIYKSWAIRRYQSSQGIPLVTLAAPSSDPVNRRANSVDTYHFFCEKFHVMDKVSMLLITSQIYVPYQQLEAIRTLAVPQNVYLETVGYPSEWNGQLTGMGKPGNYLQEIRSTLQAAQRFVNQFC